MLAPGDSLEEKDATIQQLVEEVNYTRRAIGFVKRQFQLLEGERDDLLLAKSALGKLYLKASRTKGAKVPNPERTSAFVAPTEDEYESEASEAIRKEFEEEQEIPDLVDLPEEFSQELTLRLDLPPVIVEGDHIRLKGMIVRFGERLGKGAQGKVVSGRLSMPDKNGPIETGEVAIKAVLKSGQRGYDDDVYKEIIGLHVFGEKGIAPSFVAAIETPRRFLVIMVRALQFDKGRTGN